MSGAVYRRYGRGLTEVDGEQPPTRHAVVHGVERAEVPHQEVARFGLQDHTGNLVPLQSVDGSALADPEEVLSQSGGVGTRPVVGPGIHADGAVVGIEAIQVQARA